MGYDEACNTLRLAINDTHLILIDHENVDDIIAHFDTGEGTVHAHTIAKPEYKHFERDPDDEEESSYDFARVNDPVEVQDVSSVITGDTDIKVFFDDPRDRDVFAFTIYAAGYLDYICYKDEVS